MIFILYFFLNFFMDLASLLITGLILSEKARLSRTLASAAAGALFSVFVLVFGLGAVWRLLLSLPSLAVLIFLAFGKKPKRRFLLLALFFCATSLFLGGVVEAVYYFSRPLNAARRVTLAVFLFLLLAGFTVWEWWGKGMRRRMETGVISLSISRGEKNVALYGLVDSGSFLREPLSGYPVILLKAESADALFTPPELERLRLGKADAAFPLYAVPLSTPAGRKVLFGFRPKTVSLHPRAYKRGYRETGEVIVALDFDGGAFAGCPCLVPLSMV